MSERKENGRDRDGIVNDSVAKNQLDLPIDRQPDREDDIAVNADELGRNTLEENQPPEKRD